MSLKDLVTDPAWLFELGFSIHRWTVAVDPLSPDSWSLRDPSLGDLYRLPALQTLTGVENPVSDSWMAWSDNAILFQAHLPQSRTVSALDAAISLDFYIDTRSSRGIHRANAYCHLYQLRFRPPADLPLESRPVEVRPGLISRAKGFPGYPNAGLVRGWLSASLSRLEFKMVLPYDSLSGCDPMQFPEWGVHWVATDGRRRFSLARNSLTVPIDDPSLWCCVRLVEASNA